ncbi:hypothetical protein niasHS_009377 [Heterodera schachtii]|uniref:Secreted protein n=1 Tax=Heterodera schachtii TaxID=97005 RepID=A0ABD2JBV3_HETSC
MISLNLILIACANLLVLASTTVSETTANRATSANTATTPSAYHDCSSYTGTVASATTNSGKPWRLPSGSTR